MSLGALRAPIRELVERVCEDGFPPASDPAYADAIDTEARRFRKALVPNGFNVAAAVADPNDAIAGGGHSSPDHGVDAGEAWRAHLVAAAQEAVRS